jgi:hypothetical protein
MTTKEMAVTAVTVAAAVIAMPRQAPASRIRATAHINRVAIAEIEVTAASVVSALIAMDAGIGVIAGEDVEVVVVAAEGVVEVAAAVVAAATCRAAAESA